MKIRVGVPLTGRTVYINIVNQETGYVWNGAAVEAFNASNEANYAVTVTERGATKVYEADVPSGLPTGRYDVFAYVQDGASPAQADDALGGSATLDFPGSSAVVVSAPLGSITGTAFYEYVVRSGLRRRDMELQVYDELLNTILELQQIHGFDEFQTEETIEDTISTLGDYRMNVEPNTGKLMGVILVDGNFSRRLNKISKAEFDERYPSPADQPLPGRPRDWCSFGGQILVGPLPDKTSYTYREVFSSRLTSSITSSTTIPLTAQYREILKDGVLWRIWENLKNTDQADRAAKRYGSGVARVIQYENENQEPGGDFVEYQAV